MSEIKESDDPRPATVICPAGICPVEVAIFDYDRMFGHLLVDHSWTFGTSQSWILENMPEGEENNSEQ